MLIAVLGIGIFALGIWLIFALRPTDGVSHRALNWPMADMLIPVGIVMLIVMGPMLAFYGLIGN
jgi:hypothetical protein